MTVESRFEARFERWYERLTLVRAVTTVLVIAVLLVLVAGALARIVEGDTFTSLGLARLTPWVESLDANNPNGTMSSGRAVR